MQLVTVRLDCVFDVTHGMHQRKEVTFFGFQYGPKKVFGVCAPGYQSLEAGAVLTAYLERENDWTTLAGWYNHSTGDTVIESANYEVFSILVTAATAAVFLRNVLQLPKFLFLILLLMAAWSYWCIRSLLFLRQVRSILDQVKEAPLQPLAFPIGAAATNEA